jgi:hypothetical protein
MNREQIESNLIAIKTELEREVSADSIMDVTDKLMKLQVYDALSAETMRWARKLVLDEQRKEMAKLDILKTQTTVLKMLVESNLSEWLALYTYAERLNAAVHHGCDALRTIVSLYKEQMVTERFTRQT